MSPLQTVLTEFDVTPFPSTRPIIEILQKQEHEEETSGDHV